MTNDKGTNDKLSNDKSGYRRWVKRGVLGLRTAFRMDTEFTENTGSTDVFLRVRRGGDPGLKYFGRNFRRPLT
jgi:hypothetical protein